MNTLLPTLQRKLRLVGNDTELPKGFKAQIARVEIASGASGSTTEHSSDIASETLVEHRCSADPKTGQIPAAGAIVCMPCVPRSLAKILVVNEPAMWESESLVDVVLAL